MQVACSYTHAATWASIELTPYSGQKHGAEATALHQACQLSPCSLSAVQAEDGLLAELETHADDMDDDELQAAILPLAGMGPFTCTNVMMLLKRFGRVPCDSETRRHLQVRARLHRAHHAPSQC